MDSNQYAIELVIYLLVLVVHFYELIVYMLLERNAFDSIAFFSQRSILNTKYYEPSFENFRIRKNDMITKVSKNNSKKSNNEY